MKPHNAKRTTLRVPMLLALLLPACASNLPAIDPVCPQVPMKPAVYMPAPLPNYSEIAQKNIERWRKTLSDLETPRSP